MNDARRLDRIFAALPDPADRVWLSEQLEPRWRRRARRLEERDDVVRWIAGEFYSNLSSARDIAKTMRRDLLQVRDIRETDSSHRAALHRLLELSNGSVPSVTTLRNTMAGVGGQNSVAETGHDSCHSDDMSSGGLNGDEIEAIGRGA